MSKKTVFLLPFLLGMSFVSHAAVRPNDDPKNLIYFGVYEVTAGRGQLKSADGNLPVAGSAVTLRLDLPGLSSLMCHGVTDCAALKPKLFVRFHGRDQFQEIPALPEGWISGRGPMVMFSDFDVPLQLPSDADRIEVYMHWDRVHWYPYNCRIAYDMTECDITVTPPFDGIYLSDYGRNFGIPVAPRASLRRAPQLRVRH